MNQASPFSILLLLAGILLTTAWGQNRQAPNSSVVDSDYRLSPGDIINLETLNDPKGSGTLRISRKGYAEHPYMGALKIAGLTEHEAASAFERALRGDYLINPKVRITVLSYAKIHFSVIGAVNSPGKFEEPANQPITLIHAIARAGDFKDIANRKKVIVRRTINGKAQHFRVNVKALLEDPDLPPFTIQDGDTIEIKESLF